MGELVTVGIMTRTVDGGRGWVIIASSLTHSLLGEDVDQRGVCDAGFCSPLGPGPDPLGVLQGLDVLQAC
jgi:hypothetical protein